MYYTQEVILMEDSRTRSFVKGISWRVIATLTTMTLVFLFTSNLAITVGVGIFDILTKLLFYYIHERVWLKITWGRYVDTEKSVATVPH